MFKYMFESQLTNAFTFSPALSVKSDCVLVIPVVVFPSGSKFASSKLMFAFAFIELKAEITELKSELSALKSSFIAVIALET